MSDDPTMFDVEPMSWEETATRLQAEKIELHDEIERLRSALRGIAKEANEGGVFHEGICADSGHRCAYVAQMAHAALHPGASDAAG